MEAIHSKALAIWQSQDTVIKYCSYRPTSQVVQDCGCPRRRDQLPHDEQVAREILFLFLFSVA